MAGYTQQQKRGCGIILRLRSHRLVRSGHQVLIMGTGVRIPLGSIQQGSPPPKGAVRKCPIVKAANEDVLDAISSPNAHIAVRCSNPRRLTRNSI